MLMTGSTYGENVKACLEKVNFLRWGSPLPYRYRPAFILQQVRITTLDGRAAPSIIESTPVVPTAAIRLQAVRAPRKRYSNAARQPIRNAASHSRRARHPERGQRLGRRSARGDEHRGGHRNP